MKEEAIYATRAKEIGIPLAYPDSNVTDESQLGYLVRWVSHVLNQSRMDVARLGVNVGYRTLSRSMSVGGASSSTLFALSKWIERETGHGIDPIVLEDLAQRAAQSQPRKWREHAKDIQDQLEKDNR